MARIAASNTTMTRVLTAMKEHTMHLLSPEDQAQYKRWHKADDLIFQYENIRTVIEMLKETFDISESQAWRDVRQARKLIASKNPINKPFEQRWHSEFLKEIARMAFNTDNYKDAITALKESAKILQLDKEDSDSNIYQDLQPHTYIMEITLVAGEVNRKTRINLEKIDSIQDVEFEEIIQNIERTPSLTDADMTKLLDKNAGIHD